MAKLSEPLASAIAELEDDKAIELVKQRLDGGTKPLEIVRSLQEGMSEVGSRFEAGDYFLSELILAGEAMKGAMDLLEPHLGGVNQEHRGDVVIGTVHGDVHDLGKNIVVMLLKGAGYNVIDLGVDVPADKFVDAIKEHNAPLVGMSVLLTGCQPAMKDTITAIRNAGLQTKVIIGGNYVDEIVKNNVGADFIGVGASDAVKYANQVFAG
ncbi:cobalamin B12-binding domain-containing protein [Desulfosporosinus youngiae]|uniref:Putative cobalamin binding protein n=1 Tax=Desulfosporosinus youngiae DSM 17734 TaxID=768710 RepID=H5XUP0_9FIRM|nr:cobalamin-dependent protein [Desulfosporosinus youngiae]EHQ89058.1 putative cobalamin binding protein [Desulfosporosinus youngiae DSM 17734]